MNNQLSHKALTIYLRNLRTLEFIKHKCEESIEKINKKAYNIEFRELKSARTNYPGRPVSKPTFWTSSCECFLSFCFVALLFIFLGFEAILISLPIAIIISFIVGTIYYNRDKKNYIAKQQQFENEQRKYNSNVNYYETKLKNFNFEAQRRINSINAYIRQIDNQLQKSYSLNIIPIQFRDIYGVTYLYDFISTSRLSLSDAVLNCNLEQIKSKLDVIISKCDEIIHEQQRTNANLREIQRQNNQLLAEARNISHNTALAAQYSEIAATNSAVSLELQKKQLAYQEVDFWLNSI